MPIKQDQMEALREDYIRWLRFPDSTSRAAAGEPTSKNAWAKKHNVNRTTIWRWEQDNDFKKQVYDQNLRLLSSDDVHKIISALKGKAFSGNVQAAKMLLEWSGLKDAIMEEDEESKLDLSNLSDSQLDKMLEGYDADA